MNWMRKSVARVSGLFRRFQNVDRLQHFSLEPSGCAKVKDVKKALILFRMQSFCSKTYFNIQFQSAHFRSLYSISARIFTKYKIYLLILKLTSLSSNRSYTL